MRHIREIIAYITLQTMETDLKQCKKYTIVNKENTYLLQGKREVRLAYAISLWKKRILYLQDYSNKFISKYDT